MDELGRMCFVCGTDNPIGMKLDYKTTDKNTVEAVFIPGEEYQGYDDIMHGGLVTTLLDEAMVKVLNAQSIKAVTAEVKVRFKKTIPIGQQIIITGILKEQRKKLFYTEGFVKNELGEILAMAKGKFMEYNE